MRFSSGSNLFKSTLFRRSVLCFIALFILFSFGLHIAHMNHHHEEAVYGVGLEAVMHNTDRKWLFVLITISLTILVFGTRVCNIRRYKDFYKELQSKIVIQRYLVILKSFNSLFEALRRGVIQPLVYE